jgi:hypothetical protein
VLCLSEIIRFMPSSAPAFWTTNGIVALTVCTEATNRISHTCNTFCWTENSGTIEQNLSELMMGISTARKTADN